MNLRLYVWNILFLGLVNLEASVCRMASSFADLQSYLDDETCDTIYLPEGVFYGGFEINRPVTLIGAPSGESVLSALGSGRVLYINAKGSVKLENLQITDGLTLEDGAGIYLEKGELTLINTKFLRNIASEGNGGGLFVNSGLHVMVDGSEDFDLSGVSSVFYENHAVNGSAIYASEGASLEVNNSLIQNNYTAPLYVIHEGGAICGSIIGAGQLVLYQTSFVENMAMGDNGTSALYWRAKEENQEEPGSSIIAQHVYFTGNQCPYFGSSTVNLRGDNIVIEDSHFEENETEAYSDFINVIRIRTEGVTQISRCVFSYNGPTSHHFWASHPFYSGSTLRYFTWDGRIELDSNIFKFNTFATSGAVSCDGCGTLNVKETHFDQNTGYHGAGAIYYEFWNALGGLHIERSVFEYNTSYALMEHLSSGGAIYLLGGFNESMGAYASISESTFEGNYSSRLGGAIYLDDYHFDYASDDLLRIQRSTFSHNASGGYGGAIHVLREDVSSERAPTTIQIETSTFSGNTAYLGGGALSVDGSDIAYELNRVTVKDNRAFEGSAFYSETPSGDQLYAENSIFNSTSGSFVNCNDTIVSYGSNIEDGDSCGFDAEGDMVDTDPLLSRLADHGGYTETHRPKPRSPAINRGNESTCIEQDQRGEHSVDQCDIGSTEFTTGTSDDWIDPGLFD